MSFLIGKDLQIPFTRRWFLDPVMSVGYFNDAISYADAILISLRDAPGAMIPTKTII